MPPPTIDVVEILEDHRDKLVAQLAIVNAKLAFLAAHPELVEFMDEYNIFPN